MAVSEEMALTGARALHEEWRASILPGGTNHSVRGIIKDETLFSWENLHPENRESYLRTSRTAITAALSVQVVARPLDEWHEDMGAVLWWKFPVTEAPWVGSPLDDGKILTLDAQITVHDFLSEPQGGMLQFRVGGWPGYHTHFTPLPAIPAEPVPASTPVRSS